MPAENLRDVDVPTSTVIASATDNPYRVAALRHQMSKHNGRLTCPGGKCTGTTTHQYCAVNEFGEEMGGASADGVTLRFTGKERDADALLDYFGARYMSSAQGRFTSPDPIQIMPQKLLDPQQWNMYSYVRNNPLRLVDPTGMYTTDCAQDDKACYLSGL